MNYGFALRAQSQLGLPLAKKDTHIDLTKMRFSQNHILVSHKRNMEFFHGLHAFMNRTQSQTVELDALCEYTLRKNETSDERLNQSQWKWVFFQNNLQ